VSANELRLRVARSGFALDVDLGWDERVAVIFGPSGCGKSTLLESILGLHPDPSHRVRLGGIALDEPNGAHLPIEKRALGWVPQDVALFPHLTVDGNLRAGMRRAGSGGESALARAVDVLGLSDLRERRVHELSGGERQRVAIGRALASGPHALLLDEPLAALDVPLRARVLPYLLRVRDELDLPILYITHDPDEAMLVGEVAIVLDGGRVVATGPPNEVLWSRAVLPLSEALGIENVLEGRVVEPGDGSASIETTRGLRVVIPAPAPLEPGEWVRLGLRAEDVILASEAPGPISARNVLAATVSRCETDAGSVHVHLDARERLVAKVTPAAAKALSLAPGVHLHLMIKAQAFRRLG
jgi:molybdate transport system ATP-binding protein